jgi:hypothetical protein
MTTLTYPPFMLARLCSTLDHLTGGTFGWNIVTSGEDTAAQNFGLFGAGADACRQLQEFPGKRPRDVLRSVAHCAVCGGLCNAAGIVLRLELGPVLAASGSSGEKSGCACGICRRAERVLPPKQAICRG